MCSAREHGEVWGEQELYSSTHNILQQTFIRQLRTYIGPYGHFHFKTFIYFFKYNNGAEVTLDLTQNPKSFFGSVLHVIN